MIIPYVDGEYTCQNMENLNKKLKSLEEELNESNVSMDSEVGTSLWVKRINI